MADASKATITKVTTTWSFDEDEIIELLRNTHNIPADASYSLDEHGATFRKEETTYG